MPEMRSRDWRFGALGALASGMVFALVAGVGGALAAVCATLAQPAFALAVRIRSQRGFGDLRWLRLEAQPLLELWTVTALLLALGLVWPLSALRHSGSLGAVLALSLLAGVMLLALWRWWPLWHGIERDGGGLAERWNTLPELEYGVWRGLGVATIVAALALTPLLLVGNELTTTARWSCAVALALLGAPLHWLLQSIAPAQALSQLPAHSGLDAVEKAASTDGQPAADESLEDALYAAARAGRVERALALLDTGADPHAMAATNQSDQRSLLVLAAVLPDLRLLRALIGAGLDLNAAHAGMTPLLAATRDSWHGRPEAVMTLLANGADPRASDAEGNTALHHAARSSDPGVAALLRDAAAELEVRNLAGLTPLGIACVAGNWRLARFLLERGASPQVEGATPAIVAAAGTEEDDAAGVQLLLKHKARVDARDAQGRSALHEAATAGHTEVLAALLAANADVHARDASARTPLLNAAHHAHLQAVNALVAAGSVVTEVDAEARTALILACAAETSSLDLVQRLLELGIDPKHVDAAGKRAVEHAAQAGRWSLVALLDPDYPVPSTVSDDNVAAPLQDRPPQELLREGLEAGRYDALDGLAQLLSPTQLASLLLDPETPTSAQRTEWLLAHGADAERHSGADTAIFALLSRGSSALPALLALLRHGVAPAGTGGLTRFLAACLGHQQTSSAPEDFALELLARGADPFARSPNGDPALALAIRLGWQQMLERLIAHGVDVDARDSHGMSALHLAAALDRAPALKTLIAHGASPDLHAADGQTPLGVALSAGRRDLADWLDWRGWPLPRRPLLASDIPAAAIVGDVDAVRRLLDLGFAVDAVDMQGCTGLLRAAGGGHRDTVDLLLTRGADPQRAANTGATPLSAAVSMRHVDIVERLLEAGAPLEQRLPGEVTVLMLAAALGLPDLCGLLLQAGADVHAGDAQGLTPLHCAALFGFSARDQPRLMALLDILLLAGAAPDALAVGDVTPLLLLLGARAEPGTLCHEEVVLSALERLLDEDVVVDAQDPRGFGPLHLAALHGLLRVTRELLRAGCDPDLRDSLNRSPREIAVMRGFVDVAGEYAPAIPGGVAMARFLREPQ